MKKASVISILIIFIAAIFVVGFLGMDLVVYNPVVYVTGIEWNSSELEANKNFKIEKYEEKNEDGHDAKFKYTAKDGFDEKGLTINIKCHAVPLNATNTNLNYYIDTQGIQGVKYTKLSDQTLDLTFNQTANFTLFVTSDDAKEYNYVILFDIFDWTDIAG